MSHFLADLSPLQSTFPQAFLSYHSSEFDAWKVVRLWLFIYKRRGVFHIFAALLVVPHKKSWLLTTISCEVNITTSVLEWGSNAFSRACNIPISKVEINFSKWNCTWLHWGCDPTNSHKGRLIFAHHRGSYSSCWADGLTSSMILAAWISAAQLSMQGSECTAANIRSKLPTECSHGFHGSLMEIDWM